MKTRIIENSDEIIFRYAPVGNWIFGGILVIAFIFFSIWAIYSAVFNLSNFLKAISDNLEAVIEILFFVAMIIVVADFKFNIKPIFFAPLITLTVNQKVKNVEILQQRFYGKNTQRFYFHQIEKFKSYKGRLNPSVIYYLSLILANRKEIKLKIPIGDDKQETTRLVKKLNKLIKSKVIEKKVGNG